MMALLALLRPTESRRANALLAILAAVMALFILAFGLILKMMPPAAAHGCWPSQCCSGHDCRVVQMEDVAVTPFGFFVKSSGELIAFADERVKRTPTDCGPVYGHCTEGGDPGAKTICLYIPNWSY